MELGFGGEIFKIFILVLLTVWITPKCLRGAETLLRESGFVMENYRGSQVVAGIGIAFLPVLLPVSAAAMLLFPAHNRVYEDHLFLAFVMGFAGLLDDMIGNKSIKGLRRHLMSFLKGRFTTGFFKAFAGLCGSFIVSIHFSRGLPDFLLNFFIIALFTNALNLMDLRPGRCGKVFLAVGGLCFLLNLTNASAYVTLLILLTAAGIYLGQDLGEWYMLGDTGSNILGITLGYFCALSLGFTGRLVAFVVLLLLNVAAEKISISKVISRSPVLNYLDNLGRISD
jgi:UDP-GlcNAc:undecaprenyl-phosphate GlcNAc-1-phosphate transferase